MAITSQIGIIDQTTADGLTGAALAMWQAMVQGAERMGLTRIVMTAGAGGGHLSHSHGTEIDLVAYNADGSRWTAEQRVGVAAAAAAAGGNRFGFYSGGRGGFSLHVGLGYSGAPRNVAWGPNGQTGGVSVNAFAPVEREFVTALRGGSIDAYLSTTPAGRAATGNIEVAFSPYEGNPFGVRPTTGSVDVLLAGLDDFKDYLSSEDEAKDVAAAENRRAMLDSIAPAVRNVVERGGLLRVGVDGDAVRQLQSFLNRSGFKDAEGNALDEDAEFGPRTRQALIAYQTAHGVTADGILGPQTFGRMATDITGMDMGPAIVAPPVYTPSPPMQQAAAAAVGEGIGRRSEGEAVRELQAWLNFHGYVDSSGNTLALDGDFGPRTEQALVAAQRAAGVPLTGRLDPATSSAFQALDQHEVAVTMPDVNATAPVDDALPPVAVRPVPDRSYEEIYDQPTTSDAQASQYAAEKGMVTEQAAMGTTFPGGAPGTRDGQRAPTLAPRPTVPPGWRPIPPEMAAREEALRRQQQEMRREWQADPGPVTAAADATPAVPLVRSAPAPRGQAVLSWAIPVRAAPVGPLASPYPVRVSVQPAPLTRQQIAARDGAAIVAGANRMGAGVDPAAVVAGMPQITLPTAQQAFDPATQAEAARAATDEMAANAAAGRNFRGMPDRDLFRAAPTAAEMPAWRAEVDRQAQERAAARLATINAATAAAPPGSPGPADPTPVGAVPADVGPFGTMSREELMGVNPANLTREEWTAYDAALTRALNDLKSAGPDWLRDKLRRNGAPAERVAGASAGDLIAMSTQVDKRMVPAGLATVPPKPPKNNALDKTRLLVRPAKIPAAAALA